jgi:hypothetical protein
VPAARSWAAGLRREVSPVRRQDPLVPAGLPGLLAHQVLRGLPAHRVRPVLRGHQVLPVRRVRAARPVLRDRPRDLLARPVAAAAPVAVPAAAGTPAGRPDVEEW